MMGLMELFLIFGVLGVIGVTFWVAWIIFKERYKDKIDAPAQPAPPPPTAKKPVEIPLLQLRHTPASTWEIVINGQHYSTLEAVPDDDVRQEVVAGLKKLVTFARNYVQKTQTAKRQPPVPPTDRRKPGRPLAPEPPRVSPSSESRLRRPEAAPVLMPSIDLAGEIGEIVEEMQVRVPSLAGRSVRLQNAPSGGIQFAIDGIVYPDVEAIPDRDIQALIRAATQEWERR